MKTSAVTNTTKTHRRQQDVPKNNQKITGPAPYRQSQFPKRSAYSANKKRTTPVKKEYEKKSSRDQHDRKTKSVNGTLSIGKAYKKETEEATTSSGKKLTSPRKKSIFVTPPRDYKDIEEDVIQADCMNYGYRIEKTVGEGAYAKVKLAEVLNSKLARNADMCEHVDTDGNFKVAIKVIEARSVPREFLKKFLPRELENHCPLPVHKNVVRVFEQFRTADRYYVVMEYCSNGDLLDLINCRISESCKGLGEDRARSLFKMMVEGMNHIHANGIVHRDLKCENILLDRGNNIKVTDFGFSCRFTPGESSLLKTSCGSYAYTAPEVIKLKPYDGTKSDVWSLGIILFAMLNGRLPFNDAQLNDLEEDMKMQRLRFERTVSFESMVLVRRILQFNPSNRPTMAEILNDSWLTGKCLIPRQQTKPKWTNPYGPHQSPRPDCGSKDGVHGNTVYYKGTLPEYGDEATITVNHEKNETVTLKSRTGSKKNIWINGPRSSQRPNTWPNADKPTNQKLSSRPPKGASKPRARGSSAGHQKNRTIVVVKQAESKKRPVVPSNTTKSPRVSQKTIELSKWFLGKYMAGKENNKPSTDSANCVCCKAETKCSHREIDVDDPDLCFLDSDIMPTLKAENDDFRFPSPIKNVPTISQPELENSSVRTEKQQSNGTKTTTPASCGRKSMTAIRKSPTKATVTARHGAKSAKVATTKQTTTTPDFSRNTNVVNYMVNRSTSPAERVKYFRDRLMKLYGNDRMDKQAEGSNGLPPLMVQSLNSPRGTASSTLPSSTTNDVIKSPTQISSYTPPPGAVSGRQTLVNAWRTGHYKTGTTVKPVQRVIVHSSIT